jgi:5-formyltetrahydrofolate cyclo-ligase
VTGKSELRQRVIALRDGLSVDVRAALSDAIVGRARAEPRYQQARCVLAYMSFRSELSTRTFLQRVIEEHRILVLPRINKLHRVLDLFCVADLDSDLIAGPWGIREPDPTRCPAFDPLQVDFVLTPGVAFDTHCDRLGYGAGFYDRLLSAVSPQAFKLAAAFDLQIVDRVPLESHDLPVDKVITERAIYTRTAQ